MYKKVTKTKKIFLSVGGVLRSQKTGKKNKQQPKSRGNFSQWQKSSTVEGKSLSGRTFSQKQKVF